MPNFEPIRPEQLNAYVDGELSRADSAAVARAAARNPAIAAQIATLREMKAAVSELVAETDIQVPGLRSTPVWNAMATVAAALVICLCGGLLYAFLPESRPAPALSPVLQAHHQDWTFGTEREFPLALPAGARESGWPPDLASARLTYAGLEPLALPSGPGVRIGYHGTRGCRLSLFILPGAALPEVGSFTAALHVRGWTIGSAGFLLMADGMPKRRFEDIAAALESSLRTGRPFDAPTRRRLALARRTSPPCQA